jgi:hypothetical protein
VTDADARARLAFHEAGHACCAVEAGMTVEAASLRPGRGFHGVTLLGIPSSDLSREETEQRIVVTLAGDVGALFTEPLIGHPTPSPRAERAAVALLKRASPGAFDRLMRAEADDELESDEALAWQRSVTLCDFNEWIASAHLVYLRRLALRTVELHLHALRKLAGELYSRTVVSGTEIASIVSGFRCVCHRDWGPPRASASPDEAA